MSTDSLCPECFAKIPLEYVRDGRRVIQRKTCPEHGLFENLIWDGRPDFDRWCATSELNPPVTVLTESERGCPFDCGVCSEHRQQACCVVVEVTERCNQHCPVCYAASEASTLNGMKAAEDRPLSAIIGDLAFLKEISESRPFNLQLSGGEPTMRDDLPEIITAAAELGFPYIQLNTNGRRIAEEEGYAQELAAAGLSAVFLQFDGLSDDIYLALRGEPLAELKLRAVENCGTAGTGVVLVVTLVAGINDGELGALVNYVADSLPRVRGLHIQPVSLFGRYPAGAERRRITIPGVFAALEKQTGGAVNASAFSPLSAGHPLCSFNGRFYLDDEGRIRSLPGRAGTSCSCGTASSSILKARDYLADNWTLPSGSGAVPAEGSEYSLKLWDDYIGKIRTRGFSITGMAFQDAYSLDLERLSACRVHVLAPGRRLIPFCAYNLTDNSGRSLHRGKND